MKTRVKALQILMLTFLLSGLLVGPSLQASATARQKPETGKSKDVHAQKSRGDGADDNIKDDTRTNDPSKPAPAPPNKGGEKSRGGQGYCKVIIDNHTGWNIDVY